MRAAAMLNIEGADDAITSRQQSRADAAAKAIQERFGFTPRAIEAKDNAARAAAIKGAQVVFGTGAIGVELLAEADWKDNPSRLIP